MSSTSNTPVQAQSTRAYLARVVLLAIVLAAAWLLWSGFFKPLMLMLGAFSCVIVLITAHRMHLFDTDTGLRI